MVKAALHRNNLICEASIFASPDSAAISGCFIGRRHTNSSSDDVAIESIGCAFERTVFRGVLNVATICMGAEDKPRNTLLLLPGTTSSVKPFRGSAGAAVATKSATKPTTKLDSICGCLDQTRAHV